MRRSTAGGVLALALLGYAAPPVHAQEILEVTGEVHDLYPGVHRILDVVVDNPHDVVLEVTGLDVVVAPAGPGCPAEVLAIGPAGTGIEVPADGTGIVPVEVTMVRTAPTSCQGATWPLSFHASTVGAEPAARGRLPGTGGNLLLAVVAMVAVVLVGPGLLRHLRGRRGAG